MCVEGQTEYSGRESVGTRINAIFHSGNDDGEFLPGRCGQLSSVAGSNCLARCCEVISRQEALWLLVDAVLEL